MKLLYLDAAGDIGYPVPYGKSNTKFYILAGLSVDPVKDWADARQSLSHIVKEYFPDKTYSPKEMHYADLISKKKPFDSLSGNQRKALADEVFDLILLLEPLLFAIVVNKSRHREKYTVPEKPNILAPGFSRHLTRISDKGALVYDSEERNINKELRDFLFESRETGVVLQPADVFFIFRTG